MNKIRVLFVLPKTCTDSSQASEIMTTAYESCQQNSINVSWIEEAKFESTDLAKTDFVVFQEFEGADFEALKASKCARILGPWCILVCLTEGSPIPNYTWPIYNVAMAGCVVSCSHLPKAKKLEIREKVQLMGGCYSDSLMSTNTHLVTESVKSEKYVQAAESGVKLMVSRWVDAVWEASQARKAHCSDEEFNKYKCLPFHNLTICSTGFPTIEMRTEVAQSVAKNGGVFTASLTLAKTDVLIVYGESGALSQKYKAARTNPNIFCVTVDWVHDSIAKGYAVPHSLYSVRRITSTPTRGDETCPDFSIVSAIGDANDRNKTTLEETKQQPSFATPTRISPNKRKCSSGEDVGELIDGLDIKKAKRAGQYLDGCSVYVAGFRPEQREKLCKILNLSGATRYDDISDRLTHIIIGDASCPEVRMIKSKNIPASLVSLRWLLDSMEKQQAADEDDYLITLNSSGKEQFSSPLSRKGLNLLRSSKTLTSSDVESAGDSSRTLQEPDLMQQYLRSASQNEETDTLAQLLKADSNFNSRPDLTEEAESSTHRSGSSQALDVFASKKFLIANFAAEESHYIKEQIESAGGTVMSKTYKGIPDFLVAPTFVSSPIQASALEIVNNLWIFESIQEGEECPISYFHRPLLVPSTKPLRNSVVTISGYTTFERNFLKELIEELGGDCQEQFARIQCSEKGVSASTHLVSLEASGKKYAAAVKWGLPVVSKEWLLECAKTGRGVPVEDFLIGEAKSAFGKSAGSVMDSTKTTPSEAKRRILTPLNQKQPLDISKTEQTPLAQRLFRGVAETPDPCSQVTPVNKLMEEVRRTNLLGTPQTPPMPKSLYDVDTPESPFGAFIRPHLSPKSKKELMRYINCIPDFVPPPKDRKSTPLSEVKRRCWKKLLGQQQSPGAFAVNRTDASSGGAQEAKGAGEVGAEEVRENGVDGHESVNTEVNTQNVFISTKLKQIEDMVSAIGGSRRESKVFQSTVPQEVGSSNVKESQPFTVGWDYNESMSKDEAIDADIKIRTFSPKERQVRIFMLSGVEKDLREAIVAKIESLGGRVTDLSTYDPKSTHLLSPKPARNEKALACMAAGKWILHISYVDKSVAAGRFLNEEEFEFGNPKCKISVRTSFDDEAEARLQSMHWWRKEISRRGYGAFNDMRAVVVAQKREQLIRVIEAGGGQIVDAKPPFNEPVHATHCLLEVRSVPDFGVYNPLAQQGILCINTLYISDFLFKTNKDVKEAILPQYSRFY